MEKNEMGREKSTKGRRARGRGEKRQGKEREQKRREGGADREGFRNRIYLYFILTLF